MVDNGNPKSAFVSYCYLCVTTQIQMSVSVSPSCTPFLLMMITFLVNLTEMTDPIFTDNFWGIGMY